MNKVFLIGNLTRDPEMVSTSSGKWACKFSLAVNRAFANANGDRECDFFDIVVWGNLAENCGKYLEKGKKAGIIGRLQTRTYQTERGENRKVTEIVADEVEFLSPRDQAAAEPKPQQAKKKSGKPLIESEPVEGYDLPF